MLGPQHLDLKVVLRTGYTLRVHPAYIYICMAPQRIFFVFSTSTLENLFSSSIFVVILGLLGPNWVLFGITVRFKTFI